MKSQFQSTENLVIRLTPFVSKADGAYVVTGTDVCTLSIEKPDGTLHTGATVTATWDAVSKTWKYTITTGSYVQGEWVVYAVSDDADCLPKWQSFNWGDYVDNLISIAAINTKLGTPAGASVSADIAAVGSTASSTSTAATAAAVQATAAVSAVAAVSTKIGTPVGASISADIAAVNGAVGAPVGASLSADVAAVKVDALAAKSAAQSAQTSATVSAADIALLKKVAMGRWKINGTQLVLYEIDGATEFKRFDLKDDLGNPSGTRIFERVPQ